MPKERYFFDGELKKDSSIILEGQEAHHLLHVMRASVQDVVEIINGKGYLAYGVIDALKRSSAIISIQNIRYENPSSFHLILAQAIIRGHRLDTILEKGTELGMTEIKLWEGDRSEKKKTTQSSLERMKGVTIAALKQCGSLWLPKISLVDNVCQWTTLDSQTFFGDVGEKACKLAHVWKDGTEGVTFVIGPESGLSTKETLKLQELGAIGITLHKNILRAETAAITALAQSAMLTT